MLSKRHSRELKICLINYIAWSRVAFPEPNSTGKSFLIYRHYNIIKIISIINYSYVRIPTHYTETCITIQKVELS